MDVINKFEAFIRSKRSKNTADGYITDINQLVIYLKEHESFNGDFKSVTEAQVEEYTQYCTNILKNKAQTVYRKLTSFKRFWDWMKKNKIVDSNIADSIERPTFETKEAEFLYEDEFDRMLDSVLTYKNYRIKKHHTIRDFTIMYMFITLGLRSSELSDLTLQDIDIKNNYIIIKNTKGKKSRVLHMVDDLCKLVENYLTVRDIFKPKKEYESILFISNKGTQYSSQGILDMIKKYADEANIDKNVYTHMLRHTYGYLTLKRTGDLRGLQEAMGHSKSSTTDIYAHLDGEQKKATMIANPYAKMDDKYGTIMS